MRNTNNNNDRLTTGTAILLIFGFTATGVASAVAIVLLRAMGWLP